MKKFNLIMLSILLLITSFLISCGDIPITPPPTDPPDEPPPIVEPIEKTYVGKLEKGAFQQGAEIIAYGWDPDDGFTGESFATVTSDDLGNYTLKSAKIKDMLYVKAEGYFYNENTGLISDSTLKLYGMVDSTKTPWNINVLTHLIKDRVMFLLESGSDYDTSVSQSITELFSNFDWTAIDPGTQSVANNAELLLLSAAICKGRTVSEISNLLTTLTTDLADGTIDVSILDNNFYNLDVTQIETNMNNMYGSSPTLQGVKDALITFRNITGPPPKIYTIDPITGYDFFYMTESNYLKGLNTTTKLIDPITIDCLVTQSGEDDRTVSVNFQSFYTVSGIIYYSALIDSEIKYISQNGSVVTIIDQVSMALKPVKDRVTLDHTDFQIVTDFYDPYTVSDITVTNSGGGITRNILVVDYFIGYRSTLYGIYYVAIDEEEIIRKSGLYFIVDGATGTTSIIVEDGELWKL